MKDPEAPCRLVLPQFLSSEECKELEFIHKSCGVVGYRPCVLSTTMSHLVATNCANLIMPMLSVRGGQVEDCYYQRFSRVSKTSLEGCGPHFTRASREVVDRQRVKEVIEQHFGREYELFIEFTGLISWTKGANIGWHSDDNRPYLQQRHYSAVCYLNNYEQDFNGGLFHFQEGETPLTIIPSVGTVVIYTADERNMHRVDEITDGERCTLALWFTLDRVHDEDQKIIQQLQVLPLPHSRSPIPASSVMYKVQMIEESRRPYIDTTSDDLRTWRMASQGFSCCFTGLEDQHDRPVELIFKHKKVPQTFTSSLEALQVVQFHKYKILFLGHYSNNLQIKRKMWDAESFHSQKHSDVGDSGVCPAETSQTRAVQNLGPKCSGLFMEVLPPAEDVGNGNENLVPHTGFQRNDGDELELFLCSIQQWELYTCYLWENLFELFPSWMASCSLQNYN